MKKKISVSCVYSWLLAPLFSRMLRKSINRGSLLTRKKHHGYSWVTIREIYRGID